MGRFSEAFSDQLRRLNNNAQAALYHVFEQQLSDRGLVSAPEFFLPPNEFDIVGGVADERRGEYVLIGALDATEGTMLDWDHIEQANKKASMFLEGCNAYSPYPENNLDVLHDAFVRVSDSIDLVNNTLFILLTSGRVGGNSKDKARGLALRTEILDLSEFMQESEHTLLNINFADLGSPPEVIHARNSAEDHEVYLGVIPA